MSGTCRKPDVIRRAKGFTLLELIVVLVILGLGASIASPSLVRLVDSLDRKDQEVIVMTYLRRMPVQVMERGESFRLNGTVGFEPATRVLRNAPGRLPSLFNDVSVWVQEPVAWQVNGACSGGAIRWQIGTNPAFTTRLEAPRCIPGPGQES